jgi:hypothetical protein
MSYVTRLDYTQFLLVSQVNYTLTYFADHRPGFSHDAVRRYLQEEKLSARLLWEQVDDQVKRSEGAYLAFDDVVLDHNGSPKIEMARRQWSGNAHSVIQGIGVVTCVYVVPELDEYWLIDYRIYDPGRDGKGKLDHVRDMLDNALFDKRLPCRGVLVDSWYAERKLMMHIERCGKVYYCPLKSNRQIEATPETPQGYQRVDSLTWTDEQQQAGQRVHLKDFPKGHTVTLFRLALSTQHTDFVVTNDKTQLTASGAQEACDWRWRIEQVHRELKQTTGIEGCQCRRFRSQRNHIACSMLVWAFLRRTATATQTSVYKIKFGLLDDYMFQQLRSPTLRMQLA